MGASATGQQLEGAELDPNKRIEMLLTSARDLLDMDVAFVSEFSEDRLIFRALAGEAESFGWKEGESIPLSGSYCKRLIEGSLPNVIPDAYGDARLRDLEVTHEAGIGSYVGIPLELSDGRLYGTLCCLSHASNPLLAECDLRGIKRLARKTLEEMEKEGYFSPAGRPNP